MSRGVLVRLLLVLGLLAGCAALALNREPRLGLDLRGGTQITLQASSTDRVEANAESTDRAIEVLRGRVDALGISEPTLTRAGETGSSSSCPTCRTRARRSRPSAAPRS